MGMNSPSKSETMPREFAGWIPVLVRLADYAVVTQLVATREAERGQEPNHTVSHRAELGGRATVDPLLATWPAWPEKALRRLAASSSLTAERWVRAMDAIAVGDADWYSTSEVAQLSGLTVNEWRDAPRKISRHLKAHYQDVPVHEGHLVWPLRAGGQPDKPDEVSWGMSPVTKGRWLQLRGLENTPLDAADSPRTTNP